MLARPETYYVLVFEHVPSGRIIATATLFVERKFLRNAGLVGHIEDVSVDASRRGKNLGRRVIVALTEIAEKVGCYKTILDCNEGNIRECVSGQTGSDAHSIAAQRSTKSAASRTRNSKW